MHRRFIVLAAAVVVAAAIAVAACGEDDRGTAGLLGVGLGAVPDPSGLADYMLDLGVVPVGDERRAAWVLTNDGDAAIEAMIGPVPFPFSLEGTPSREVPARSRVELFWAFRPAADGDAEAIVEIDSKAGAHRLRLVGQGARRALSCNPASVNFGLTPIGETRRRTVTCTNGGAFSETIDIRGMEGARASAFRWDLPEQGATRALALGESLPIVIDFRPDSHGEYGVVFHVDRAGGGGRVVSILLVGTAE